MLYRSLGVLGIALSAAAPARGVTVGIAGVTGDVEVIQTPPPSVERQAYQSSTAIRVFEEREVPSPGPLPINALAAGVYHAYADFVDVTVAPPPGGIRSYLIHLDPVGTDLVRLQGSVTFAEPIVGVIGRSLTMDQTDDTLGVPGMVYPANRFNRELEFQTRGNYDYFQIQSDGRTIFLRVECTTDVDQIRVLTSVPEPGTLACGAPLLLLLWRPHRQRGEANATFNRDKISLLAPRLHVI
jgi:hypothetical protein